MSETARVDGKYHDVLVVGAGPAGLSLALSLAALGLRIAVIDCQDEAAIANPRDDGREIALTHQSMQILRALGVSAGWRDEEVSPLHSARVYNGRSARFLDFRSESSSSTPLGYLVANHCIRRELYRCVEQERRIDLLFGRRMMEHQADRNQIAIRTGPDEWLAASLLVAADSRYSETRRAMGIPSRMHDFGKTMLVFRVSHAKAHQGCAMEWFDYGRTIATLPLGAQQSSIVLTVPGAQAEQISTLGSEQLEAQLNRWLDGRLGRLNLCSGIHRYPLIAVYADRFVGRRFALVGDAAVGMHPVTAHGFNLGLSGQALLSNVVAQEMRAGGDVGSERVLSRYERQHRRRTGPLYHATNALVRLYTSDTRPARLARDIMLGVGQHFAPFKHAVVKELRS